MSNKSLLISGAGFVASFWIELEKAAQKRGLNGEQIYHALKEGAPFFEKFAEFMDDTIKKAEATDAILARIEGTWWSSIDRLQQQSLRPGTKEELWSPGFILALGIKYPEFINKPLRLITTGSPVGIKFNGNWGYPSWTWNSKLCKYEEFILTSDLHIQSDDRLLAFPL